VVLKSIKAFNAAFTVIVCGFLAIFTSFSEDDLRRFYENLSDEVKIGLVLVGAIQFLMVCFKHKSDVVESARNLGANQSDRDTTVVQNASGQKVSRRLSRKSSKSKRK